MYGKFFLNLFFAVSLFSFQASFVNSLPFLLSKINFIIIILLFVLSLKGIKFALFWVLALGLLLDVYSFLPFGYYSLSLLVVVYLVNFLLTNFLTNRSLYSYLSLGGFAILIFGFESILFKFIFSLFGEQDMSFLATKSFWIDQVYILFVNLITIALLFYIMHYISKAFQPVFLIKKKT